MSLHLKYCASFGLSQDQVESRKESLGQLMFSQAKWLLTIGVASTAYSRYMLDIGQSEDWFALQIALAPCLLGYGQIAKRIYVDKSSKREKNPYWKWVENYVADDFVEAVNAGSGTLQ